MRTLENIAGRLRAGHLGLGPSFERGDDKPFFRFRKVTGLSRKTGPYPVLQRYQTSQEPKSRNVLVGLDALCRALDGEPVSRAELYNLHAFEGLNADALVVFLGLDRLTPNMRPRPALDVETCASVPSAGWGCAHADQKPWASDRVILARNAARQAVLARIAEQARHAPPAKPVKLSERDAFLAKLGEILRKRDKRENRRRPRRR